MLALVSCSGGRTTACDPHALGGDHCGEQRGPDLEHSTTTDQAATLLTKARMQAEASDGRSECATTREGRCTGRFFLAVTRGAML